MTFLSDWLAQKDEVYAIAIERINEATRATLKSMVGFWDSDPLASALLDQDLVTMTNLLVEANERVVAKLVEEMDRICPRKGFLSVKMQTKLCVEMTNKQTKALGCTHKNDAYSENLRRIEHLVWSYGIDVEPYFCGPNDGRMTRAMLTVDALLIRDPENDFDDVSVETIKKTLACVRKYHPLLYCPSKHRFEINRALQVCSILDQLKTDKLDKAIFLSVFA